MQYPQPPISKILLKKTRVLALLIFYETRENPGKVFKVLSCVIYTIISNYLCIYYLASESKKLIELPVGSGGVTNVKKKVMKKYWELEFQIC